MIVFEKPGVDNTRETLRIALERAKRDGLNTVSATTDGLSGAALIEAANKAAYHGRLVIVTHAYGSKQPGKNALPESMRAQWIAKGVRVVTAAHALSGVERGLSGAFHGIYPAELIANSLRMLSQGIKVVVEIGCMALDAGAIAHGKPIVCMGGTAHGLDTAVVMTAAHANNILETRVHEILCKPY
ncbi:MAG: hypothetical protein LBS72_09690 [Oscillospiraceae bacterium]|nr:hypothetical protein [Oscillospiraceae bacterium]